MTVRYQRAPGLLWRRTPTAVIVRALDGRGWAMSGSGLALWDALGEPRSFEELCRCLQMSFVDPGNSIESDVRRAVESLVAGGAVVAVP